MAALVPRPRLHLIRLVSASLRFAKHLSRLFEPTSIRCRAIQPRCTPSATSRQAGPLAACRMWVDTAQRPATLRRREPAVKVMPALHHTVAGRPVAAVRSSQSQTLCASRNQTGRPARASHHVARTTHHAASAALTGHGRHAGSAVARCRLPCPLPPRPPSDSA